MNRPLYYVAHPVAGDVAQNARRARQWLAWLMDGEPAVAFTAPWLPYVDAFLERFGGMDDAGSPFRDRCMLDNRVVVARCDGIVLCGGRTRERGAAGDQDCGGEPHWCFSTGTATKPGVSSASVSRSTASACSRKASAASTWAREARWARIFTSKRSITESKE